MHAISTDSNRTTELKGGGGGMQNEWFICSENKVFTML